MASILLVDDEPELLTIYGEVLREAGYEVSFAANGREAVDEAMAHLPSLILMDIDMPELDGLSALREIRSQPERYAALARVPIVLLTSDALQTSVQEALQAGGDAYIIKPVIPAELLEELDLLLKSGDLQLEE